jgi:glycosyltransferase involved in cell wall biosynthesis
LKAEETCKLIWSQSDESKDMHRQLNRILFVITSTRVGGAEKMLFEVAKHLKEEGVAIQVCVLKEKGPYAAKLESFGVPVCSLSIGEAKGIRGVLACLLGLPRLIRVMRGFKPQIVHAFLFRANLLARIAAPLSRVPINVSSIRIIENQRPYYFALDRWTSFLVTRHVAVSQRVKEVTCRRSRIADDQVSVIRNGIQIEEVRGKRTNSAASAAGVAKPVRCFAKNGLVCGTVARLDPQKGLSFLLRGFAILAREFPSLQLVFVGEGPERSSLECLATELSISNRVRFTGLAANPFVYLRQMDVFVLPSLYEGLPNALLEAMSVGIPVVATRVGGVDEVVQDQETGLLIPPGNSEAIAEAVRFVLTHSDRAEQMAVASRAWICERFSLDRMLKEYDELYESLLQAT